MVVISNEYKKIQKNRFFRLPKKPKIIYGESCLITKNEGRIELIQLTILKKLIKKLIKKRTNRNNIVREKIWYFGRPNFYIQKKSKNSRMGKGKGLIERKVIRIRRGFVLFEFIGIDNCLLQSLVKKANKKLSVKLSVLFKKLKYFNVWSKKNKYYHYYNKYLF